MNVNFCDEKTVQTYRNGRVLVKRKVNERYEAGKLAVAETQNAKNKVHLVGLMSHSGPNVIYSVSTNLTGLEFDHLIKTKVLNIVRNSTVLMDNASIHNEGLDYLLESGVRVLVDFPPKSPHLNIIENVWGRLQNILNC